MAQVSLLLASHHQTRHSEMMLPCALGRRPFSLTIDSKVLQKLSKGPEPANWNILEAQASPKGSEDTQILGKYINQATTLGPQMFIYV